MSNSIPGEDLSIYALCNDINQFYKGIYIKNCEICKEENCVENGIVMAKIS